jgi:hypothetical protein
VQYAHRILYSPALAVVLAMDPALIIPRFRELDLVGVIVWRCGYSVDVVRKSLVAF